MKKKKNPELPQRVIDLIHKAETSAQSIKWWEDEMEKILDHIDVLEKSSDPDAEFKISKLIERLAALMPRAKIEVEIIDKMENELEDILNEKQNKIKKSPRKKNI